MRKLVLIPLAALVLAGGCGDDDGSSTNPGGGNAAAERDCTGKTLPPQAGATTVPPSNGATTTSSAGTSPSGWANARGLASTTPDSTAPGSGTSAPPTTYAPKPEISLPEQVPTKLETTDLKKGSGPKVKPGDLVMVHYVGVRSEDGTEFDSNYDSKQGFPVVVGQSNVIQGWHNGLVGMRVGGVRQLDIPAGQAYGDSPPASTPIKKGDALTFVVTLDSLFREPNVDDVEPSLCAEKLMVEDVRKGAGEQAEVGDTANIHLKVMRGDNKVVVSDTWASGQAEAMPLDKERTLPGLVDGITGMKVGGQRIITMPPSEAFGPEGQPSAGIPADTDVIAIVDLISLASGN